MIHEITKEIPQLPFRAFFYGPTGRHLMCEPHYHSQIEILYGISGKANVYVNNKRFKLAAGDMLFVIPNEVHLITTYEPTRYAVLMFYPDILYTSGYDFFEIIYTLPVIMSDPEWPVFFSSEIIKQTYIPDSVCEACSEFSEQNMGFELAVKIHIYKIFLWIMRYYNDHVQKSKHVKPVRNEDLTRLQIVFDFVDNNYTQDITISDVAKLCNVSYNYFSKNFKAVTHKNFSEYLTHIRIKAAEKLLTTTEKSVTEIAQDVGFSTTSYFISQFKKHNNVTPYSYKKRFLEHSDKLASEMTT